MSARTRAEAHTCHALNCEAHVPPRMHMCRKHWAMVPKPLQRNLWASYRPGQERTLTPSPKYLRDAAACVRAVAEKENQPADEIEFECSLYTGWADMLDAETDEPDDELTLFPASEKDGQ